MLAFRLTVLTVTVTAGLSGVFDVLLWMWGCGIKIETGS